MHAGNGINAARSNRERSVAATPLLMATLTVITFALDLPYTPVSRLFGFAPLPPVFLITLAAIMALYVVVAETPKTIFYRKVKQ